MKLWIVLKVKSEDGKIWEFQGVFDREGKAISACRTWQYCIFPQNLNEECLDETQIAEKAYYPIKRT